MIMMIYYDDLRRASDSLCYVWTSNFGACYRSKVKVLNSSGSDVLSSDEDSKATSKDGPVGSDSEQNTGQEKGSPDKKTGQKNKAKAKGAIRKIKAASQSSREMQVAEKLRKKQRDEWLKQAGQSHVTMPLGYHALGYRGPWYYAPWLPCPWLPRPLVTMALVTAAL